MSMGHNPTTATLPPKGMRLRGDVQEVFSPTCLLSGASRLPHGTSVPESLALMGKVIPQLASSGRGVGEPPLRITALGAGAV